MSEWDDLNKFEGSKKSKEARSNKISADKEGQHKKKKDKKTLNKSNGLNFLDFGFDDIWDANNQVPKLNSKNLLNLLLQANEDIRSATLKLAVAINTFCDSIVILGELLEKK